MKRLAFLALLLAAQPAHAEPALEDGLAGALRGCEEWILNPASWAEGTAPFVTTVGLGDRMSLVDRVAEANLPPPPLRASNHYWRINVTPTAGYVLVVSDRLPMCHVTGGGDADLQPIIEALLASAPFKARWTGIAETSRGDMKSTRFRSREEPSFTMTISRAGLPGQRRDRVQVIATGLFEPATP